MKQQKRSLLNFLQVSSGLVPDGRHFVSRARDEASSWRQTYKAPIPTAALANRLGSYVQAYTLYSSVRPFGVTSIIAGWDTTEDLPVDAQVGNGPKVGAGGKAESAKAGGPALYMVEPSGLYWVGRSQSYFECVKDGRLIRFRVTTAQQREREDKQQRQSWRSWISVVQP